jgi:hypothetical protein
MSIWSNSLLTSKWRKSLAIQGLASRRRGFGLKVEAWNADPEHVEVLKEFWIKVTGLQTKWCEWNILDQVVSVCGLLLYVDWLSVFRNN